MTPMFPLDMREVLKELLLNILCHKPLDLARCWGMSVIYYISVQEVTTDVLQGRKIGGKKQKLSHFTQPLLPLKVSILEFTRCI